MCVNRGHWVDGLVCVSVLSMCAVHHCTLLKTMLWPVSIRVCTASQTHTHKAHQGCLTLLVTGCDSETAVKCPVLTPLILCV